MTKTEKFLLQIQKEKVLKEGNNATVIFWGNENDEIQSQNFKATEMVLITKKDFILLTEFYKNQTKKI
jgi:hypothetical protein